MTASRLQKAGQGFTWRSAITALGPPLSVILFLGGTETGLAYRILEAGYTLEIPRMVAALALLSAAGVVIWAALSGLSWLLLRRWHESAIGRVEG